jgi:DNA polymerase-3 subunit gamma/tau
MDEATGSEVKAGTQRATLDEPYQSLYRRYRPQRFAEVRGQDHVTRALRNAVATERVSHAYLFSGPRGTGKTSTARILAKALNCSEVINGEPCGQCDSCRSIVSGSSFDVHELDAASNNGVDAMRDLVARAVLASPGRWKVYIVDEVHMLSPAASNALLKTLEEPPGHVIFVLATTDPQKVLPTIRSRTQHFEFHLLSDDVLASLLNDVASDAHLDLPDGAIDVARRRGRGSARDALSVLDQVTTAGVVDDDSDALSVIIGAIGERDSGSAMGALDEALHNGRDPHQVAIELVERLRNGFLAIVAPKLGDNEDVAAKVESAEAVALGAPRCVRAMELIGSAIVAMRDAPDPRITLEVALIRLTHPEAEDSPDAILDRIERVERRIDSLGSPPQTKSPYPPPPLPPRPRRAPSDTADATPTEPVSSPEVSAAGSGAAEPEGFSPHQPALGAFKATGASDASPLQEASRRATSQKASTSGAVEQKVEEPTIAMPSRDAVVSAWGDHVLVGLRPKLRMIYQAGRFLEVTDDDIVFALPSATQVSYAEPLRKEVEEVLSRYFSRSVRLRLIVDDETRGVRQTQNRANGASSRDLRAVRSEQHKSSMQSEELEERGEIVDEEMTSEGVGALDPKLGVAWAEDEILKAFPGAEEVRGR